MADTKPQAKPRAIVAVGASAGGIEAMRRFLSATPRDTGLGFVLVMHLPPDHVSHLAEVLRSATALAVEEAADGTPVKPNTVHVIPPDKSLFIESGTLRLTPLGSQTRSGLIDQFFQSLARDQGSRAVCTVLSGAGSDGAIGLRAIKEHGGLALAAASDGSDTGGYEPPVHISMPRAAAETGLADHVVAIEEMPGLIAAYTRHLDDSGQEGRDEAQKREIEPRLADVRARILKRTKHDLRQYKSATLVRRIQRRMQALRIGDPADYIARMDEQPQEVDALHRDILIGVTSFFRDQDAFNALAAQVLPDIVERVRADGEDGNVRIWVPACGSGEEAYSIAILLSEVCRDSAPNLQLQVFGTDIDSRAIRVACGGKYPYGIAGQLPESYLNRYFQDEGDGYRVVRSLRDLCLFSEHDLIRHPPLSRMDLISCRNLLIYMTSDLQGQLLPLFHYALRTYGYLFLGSSETLGQRTDLFSEVDKRQRVFQRRDEVAAQAPNFPLSAANYSAPPQPELHANPVEETRTRLTRKAERVVLETFGPPYVIVTSTNEAVYFAPGVGDFLQPPVGAPRSNVLDMARPGLRPALRRVLRQADQEPNGTVKERVEISDDSGGRRPVTLFASQVREYRGQDRLFTVVLQDPEGASRAAARMSPARSDMGELERELADTKSELQSTIEELETSNEELQSANEELLSMNEELQSSNEELEASKEEVQSANEELETVNSELRHKVEELNRANADLRNLIESTRIATVFLDTDHRINWFTPDARQLFNLIESDVGRPFNDISGKLDRPPARELAHVLETKEPIERQIDLNDGSATFIMRLLPYLDGDGAVNGLVLTFIDVTQTVRANADLTSLLDLVPVGIALTRDAEAAGIRINRYGRKILGLDEETTEISDEAFASFFQDTDNRPWAKAELPLAQAAQSGVTVREREANVKQAGASRQASVLMSASPLGVWARESRGAIMAFADVSDLKAAHRRQRLLLSALRHRVRNMLANIRAITTETLSNSETLDDFTERFEGRLEALALTENITSRTGRGSIDLDELARELVARESDGDQVTLYGPDVALEPRAAQILALALNELKTNAIKHGALIDGDGRIVLRWGPVAGADGREILRLRWQETGIDTLPETGGFGRELIERGVPHELGGTGSLSVADGMLTCLLDIPITPNVLSIGDDPADADERTLPRTGSGGARNHG
jgi:two-component system CheB/CheR fusion protein